MKALFAAALTVLAGSAMAEIKVEKVDYQVGGVTMEGVVAYDSAKTTARPGVMIVHDWNGIDEYEIGRARQLAEMGYVAFCADIYGKGVRPNNPADNAKEAGKFYADNALFRARLNGGLATLKKQKLVDPSRTVAMGYCFGGSGVVELARSGADVKGIVSFHGGLNASGKGDAGNVKGKVLLVHASSDPFVPWANFDAALKEMSAAKVDVQALVFNVASHAFTVPGPMYDAPSDRRSWEALRAFLREVIPV